MLSGGRSTGPPSEDHTVDESHTAIVETADSPILPEGITDDRQGEG